MFFFNLEKGLIIFSLTSVGFLSLNINIWKKVLFAGVYGAIGYSFIKYIKN